MDARALSSFSPPPSNSEARRGPHLTARPRPCARRPCAFLCALAGASQPSAPPPREGRRFRSHSSAFLASAPRSRARCPARLESAPQPRAAAAPAHRLGRQLLPGPPVNHGGRSRRGTRARRRVRLVAREPAADEDVAAPLRRRRRRGRRPRRRAAPDPRGVARPRGPRRWGHDRAVRNAAPRGGGGRRRRGGRGQWIPRAERDCAGRAGEFAEEDARLGHGGPERLGDGEAGDGPRVHGPERAVADGWAGQGASSQSRRLFACLALSRAPARVRTRLRVPVARGSPVQLVREVGAWAVSLWVARRASRRGSCCRRCS